MKPLKRKSWGFWRFLHFSYFPWFLPRLNSGTKKVIIIFYHFCISYQQILKLLSFQAEINEISDYDDWKSALLDMDEIAKNVYDFDDQEHKRELVKRSPKPGIIRNFFNAIGKTCIILYHWMTFVLTTISPIICRQEYQEQLQETTE